MRTRRAFALAAIAAAVIGGALAAGAEPPHPLAAYPGFGHDVVADEARFAREEARRERLVAACMRKAGFRYIPAPSVLVGEGPIDPDPNAGYVERLGSVRRLVYNLALTGVADPNAEQQTIRGDGGCLGRAFREIPGVYAARNALADEVDALEEAIATDPRVLSATRGWSRCMREAGFDLATPTEIHAMVDERIGSLLERDELTDERVAEAEERYDRASQANDRCDDDLRTALDRARSEHETRFVAEHRGTLERHR